MGFVQLSGINLSYGDRIILDDVTIQLDRNSRIAVCGGNGSGKSSILKIATAQLKADSGKISRSKNCRVSYLPQWGIDHKSKTLFAEVEQGFAYLGELQTEKSDLENQLAAVGADDADNSKIQAMVERLHEIQETIDDSGYYRRSEIISRILTGLGFSRDDEQRPCTEFSGGWQMRIALAKILVAHADILLLDEPTNYLDLEARNWLESFFKTYKGGIAVVSHDRFFLDATVNETIELWNGKARRYKGNYSDYEKLRAAELKTILHNYDKQQREIAKAEEFINRFRATASKASLVQSKINYLERLDIIEIPENFKKIHFSFPEPPHSGRDVLTVRDVSKSYGDINVFSSVDFDVSRGEKIVISGVNGAGKTTLLRILAGVDSNWEGSVKTGTDVSIGYFAQDSLSQVEPENTILEEIEKDAPTSLIPQLRDILGGFLFRGDDIHKQISVLSGGEISRICLIKLLLKDVNLLVLDEPTNHLDIHSKDILLDALKNYSGTLLFVSHDRYFIEKLADKVIEIDNGKALVYPGDYEYYTWKKTNNPESSENPDNSNNTPQSSRSNNNTGSLSWEEQKQQKSQIRKLERQETEVLEQIEEFEQKKEVLNTQLALPENYSNPAKAAELQKSISELDSELDKLQEKWLETSSELEQLQQAK